MKILHINTSTSQGGAAIAAYRHTEAMSYAGLDAHLLARKGATLPLATVTGDQKLGKLFEYSLFKFTQQLRKPNHSFSFMMGNYGIERIREVQEADVVYLHWVNNYLGYRDIDWLLNNKKRVVWYMHDMWPMTGGCHHALECKNYSNDCHDCPQLLKGKLFAKNQLSKKLRHWMNHDNLLMASPSQWLADRAMESALFKDRRIAVCPNVINTSLYKPADKEKSKLELGLDPSKKYILFGAAVGAKNVFKGMSFLYNALKLINSEYEMLLMGKTGDDYPNELLPRTHHMGYITDEQKKVAIYNASDVFAISSMAENFPNMVVEAMACGVPCVGFKVGGIVEQITHQQNGYLAETGVANSLAEGLEWVLQCPNMKELQHASREYVLNYCSYDIVLKNHCELLGNL